MSNKKSWFRRLMEEPAIVIYKKEPEPDDYVCKDCSYGWTSKKKFGAPAFCPRCRSNLIIKVDR